MSGTAELAFSPDGARGHLATRSAVALRYAVRAARSGLRHQAAAVLPASNGYTWMI